MANKKKTTDAVKILHGRYVKDDPARQASVQAERFNAEVAQLIYDMRKSADLSQKELAELIGTTQSVISRLEDADYDGHSLSMLNRVAEALKQKLTLVMTAADPRVESMHYSFLLFAKLLRRRKKLTVDQFARKTGIDREEVLAMERLNGYRPTPRIVHKLSQFSGIPEQRLAALAGAISDIPENLSEQASRFAAQSESFSKLTDEEKNALDEFMEFLKSKT